MKRHAFLKNSIGFFSIGSIILESCTKDAMVNEQLATAGDSSALADCEVTPSEAGGPYELDLARNSAIFRSDIREDRAGIPLSLKLRVVNTNNNCLPVSNVRVDIWHCDNDGYYSGFENDGYLGLIDYTGKTFLRGIQLTNSNGIINYQTIYPGWYPGRITHIHLEVIVNEATVKKTQIAFPDKLNKRVYQSPLYLGHGQNTTVPNNLADPVFQDSLSRELCTITRATPEGISATFVIGIAL